MQYTDDELCTLVLKAKNDEQMREKLIHENEQTILRIASKACFRYVTKSDDEWSVALLAFSQAIDCYEQGEGDFMAFAGTVIKRALIDYHRKEEQHAPEMTTSPFSFDESSEEEDQEVLHAVAKQSMETSDMSVKDEIVTISKVLSGFGFGFMDLTKNSPKQDKTRNLCKRAAWWLASNPTLFDKLLKNHQLPSLDIIKGSGVSGKILDKYRKYIITSAIILSGDYPYLAERLKPIEGRENS